MNFIYFNLLLLISGWIGLYTFSFILMAILSPFKFVNDVRNPPKILSFSLSGIGIIFQIYFWSLWSAYCVAITFEYTTSPTTWDWLYFICGYGWSYGLIGWLSYKEQLTAFDFEESKQITRGALFYKFVAVASFIIFVFWPNLMDKPFGWVLNILV
ncbi:hypothetical protein [Aliifodinibius salipaludis]|nr:hypothetical protein [Aliifodinibius salipaludis]